jgi:hypothetical protein
LSQEAEHRLRRGLDEDETISSLWGDAAQAANPAHPLNKSTKRHRAMTRFKEDLGGELADRAIRQIRENEEPAGESNPDEKPLA